MEKLSIFKIEDAGIQDTEALRVELFPGEDPDDAVVSFNAVVFKNSMPMLYRKLSKKLGDDAEWEADDDLSDCVLVSGVAERIRVPKRFYRFERNKKGDYVKVKPEREVKYAKLVSFNGGPTLEEQLERYLSNVPDECWIEDKKEDEED